MSENYAKIKIKVKDYIIKLYIECDDVNDGSLDTFYRYIFSSECYAANGASPYNIKMLIANLMEHSYSVSLEIYQNNELYIDKFLISKDSFSCSSNHWFYYNSNDEYVQAYNAPVFDEMWNILKLKKYIFVDITIPEYIQKEFNDIEKIAYGIALEESGLFRKMFLKTFKFLKLNRIFNEYCRRSSYDMYYDNGIK